jgi:hypothetical protein
MVTKKAIVTAARLMATATKRVRDGIGFLTATRVAGNEEGDGDGGKNDGNDNKEGKGKGGKRDGDCNKECKCKGGKRDGDDD